MAVRSGNIEPLKLFKIFRSMLERRMNGLLTLKRGNVRKKAHIVAGSPVRVGSNLESENLLQTLVHDGLISSTEKLEVEADLRRKKESLDSILVRRRLVSKARLQDVERRLGKLRLLDAFAWLDGRFTFEAMDLKHDPDVPGIDVVQLLLEATARILPEAECTRFANAYVDHAIHPAPMLAGYRAAFDRVFPGENVASHLQAPIEVRELAARLNEPRMTARQICAVVFAGLGTFRVGTEPVADEPQPSVEAPPPAPPAVVATPAPSAGPTRVPPPPPAPSAPPGAMPPPPAPPPAVGMRPPPPPAPAAAVPAPSLPLAPAPPSAPPPSAPPPSAPPSAREGKKELRIGLGSSRRAVRPPRATHRAEWVGGGPPAPPMRGTPVASRPPQGRGPSTPPPRVPSAPPPAATAGSESLSGLGGDAPPAPPPRATRNGAAPKKPAGREMPPKIRKKLDEAVRRAGEIVSGRPDHFAVLGVTRDDHEQTVRNAYRQLARDFHVDKFTRYGLEQEERDAVQALFMAINRANEVLTKPEERAEYLAELDLEAAGLKSVRPGEHMDAALRGEKLREDGLTAIKNNKAEVALELLTQALEIDSQDRLALAGKAYAEFLVVQARGSSPQVLSNTRATLQKVTKDGIEREEPWLYLGRVHRAAGDLDNAAVALQRAIDINRHCAEAQSELRHIHRKLAGPQKKKGGFFGRRKK